MNMRNVWAKSLLTMLVALAALFAGVPPAQAANETVTFVNLSDGTVYLATWTYQPYRPYSSSAGTSAGGSSTLPSVQPEQPEGWWFKGWWSIQPGGSMSFAANNSVAFYLERNGQSITWSGKEARYGYVHQSRFDAFATRNRWDQDTGSLVTQGYRPVTFQMFSGGRYTISGNAYRLEKKTFSFDVRSRSPKYDTVNFNVSGRVTDFSYNATYRWAEYPSWKKEDYRVSLTVYVSGRQTRPGASREPGYYSGTVTVYYTIPNR